MKNIGFILLILVVTVSCEQGSLELEPSESIGPLVGSWEYFRGVELRCNSLDEIGDFDIEEYNLNTWNSDGSFYREYMEDDGNINSYSGKWTLLGRDGDSYIYETSIDGISGKDTTYILFRNNILLNYDKDCFDVPYDPYNIGEAGEARRID